MNKKEKKQSVQITEPVAGITKIKPILFSTAMVEAIIAGQKTQTRRIIKQADGWDINWKVMPIKEEHLDGIQRYEMRCGTQYLLPWFKAKYKVGDFLWVRETWRLTDFLHVTDESYGYVYRASENGREWQANCEDWIWKPNIFMPKKACRLFLEVTDIRAERLHDISEEDCIKEGIENIEGSWYKHYKARVYGDGFDSCDAKSSYKSLWEKINGEDSWEENPYVWVINFKVVNPADSIIIKNQLCQKK